MEHHHSTQNSESRPIASMALGTASLIGAVILSGLFVASCVPNVTSVDTAVAAPTRAQAKTVFQRHFASEQFDQTGVNQRSTAHASDLPGVPDAPMPIDLYRFALNALLVPLIDDAVPPRWTDVAIDFNCGPGTSVTVDAAPLVAGRLIPSKAFTVRWDMDHCTPLGPELVALSGRVELVVSHVDSGLSAMVFPDRLRVDSHMGRAWLHGPFSAVTSLATAAIRQ